MEFGNLDGYQAFEHSFQNIDLENTFDQLKKMALNSKKTIIIEHEATEKKGELVRAIRPLSRTFHEEIAHMLTSKTENQESREDIAIKNEVLNHLFDQINLGKVILEQKMINGEKQLFIEAYADKSLQDKLKKGQLVLVSKKGQRKKYDSVQEITLTEFQKLATIAKTAVEETTSASTPKQNEDKAPEDISEIHQELHETPSENSAKEQNEQPAPQSMEGTETKAKTQPPMKEEDKTTVPTGQNREISEKKATEQLEKDDEDEEQFSSYGRSSALEGQVASKPNLKNRGVEEQEAQRIKKKKEEESLEKASQERKKEDHEEEAEQRKFEEQELDIERAQNLDGMKKNTQPDTSSENK